MSLSGAVYGWTAKNKPPPKNLSHTFRNDETWHSYILPKEDPKNIYAT